MTDVAVRESTSDKRKPRAFERLEEFDAKNTVLVPILAVISALIVGAFVVAVTDIERLKHGDFGGILGNIWDAYRSLFIGAFGSWSGISETIVFATPLILAGLAVALSFRSGLFNIGATGQMLMGGMASVYVGFSMDGPSIVQIPLALLAGIAGGAVWGGIIGLLKARTGAHEVITTIMSNYIAGFLAVVDAEDRRCSSRPARSTRSPRRSPARPTCRSCWTGCRAGCAPTSASSSPSPRRSGCGGCSARPGSASSCAPSAPTPTRRATPA